MHKLITLLFVGFCLGWGGEVLAAPSYTVSPLVIDVDAEARDIKTFEITLTNTGTQPVTVYPMVNNISLEPGGTISEFLPPVRSDRTSSLASWIEINRGGINIPLGESRTVSMTLRIHPSPKEGEYHAFIGFGHGQNDYEAEQMVKTGRAPGTVVSVTITEDVNEFIRLGRFIIDKFVTSAENESAKYRIENPGDVPIVPSGEVIFYDGKGVEVAAIPVNPNGESIAAGADKEFNVTVPTEGLFGKYKAFLSVEYGSSQLASVQDTAFFYVIPIKLLVVILFILLVFVALGAFHYHKRLYGEEHHHDDSEHISFFVKDSTSEDKDHDINLKQHNE